jgi:hypothetical protein
MVQKEGRLQAIICAVWIACGDRHTALIGQMNQPGACRAPVVLAA